MRTELPEGRRLALEGNISKCFAIMALLGSFSFSAPTVVILWKENGVSLADGVLLQMIFTITMLVLDVPTGYLADLIGRRTALVLSSLLYLAGAASYTGANGFEGFLAGELLLGGALSLASGADQALLFDTLVELGRQSEFGVLWGRAKSITFKLMALATILGGAIASWNVRAPLALTIIGSLGFVFVTLRLTEASGERQGSRASAKEVLSLAKLALIRNRRTRWLILASAFISASLSAPFWLYQPYLELTGVDIAYLGLFWAAFNLTASFASRNAARIIGGRDDRKVFLVFIGLIALAYGLLGGIVVWASGLFLLLTQLVRGAYEIAFSGWLNGEIEARRATQLSLQSMAARLMYLGALLPIRELVKAMGVPSSFRLIGISVLALGLVLTLTTHRAESR